LIVRQGGCDTDCDHLDQDQQDYVDAAITLSFLVGIIYLVMSAVRLTQISTLLAGPSANFHSCILAFLLCPCC